MEKMENEEPQAFMLGIDPIPDWFMDLVSTNQIILRGDHWGPIESADIEGVGTVQRGAIVMLQDMPNKSDPRPYPNTNAPTAPDRTSASELR